MDVHDPNGTNNQRNGAMIRMRIPRVKWREENANAIRTRETRSWCATPGKGFEALHIASDEGFFFGSGPMFDLVFSLLCSLERIESLLINELHRWI